MNSKEIPLLPGKRYHIYNHANGNENLFANRDNYRFFLRKYGLYIEPIAKTFAYCLMPNHIHFAIEVRSLEEIWLTFKTSRKFETFGKLALSDKEASVYISRSFGNLFSSYGQAFNKQQRRMGSLFIPNFKRKEIVSQTYFNNLVHYIHSNPVHHGFAKDMMEWEFSSIHAYWLEKQTRISKSETLDGFGGKEKFELRHLTIAEFSPEFEFN